MTGGAPVTLSRAANPNFGRISWGPDDKVLFAQGTDGTRAIRLYFSYVTLATLGYGDYTPAANVGRTLAVLEALLGQIYLVTVVALLVSRLRRKEED